MQILIPISSKSSFFPAEEYFFPKPLIEVASKAMIELVVNRLKQQFPNAEFIFVVDKHDCIKFSLDKSLLLLAGEGSHVVEKENETSGALCSCLLAVDKIDQDKPLLISNSDQIIEDDLGSIIEQFSSETCSGGIVTFDSVHPRWSYAVEDENKNIIQTYEKKVASRRAIAGIYYFSKASEFVAAAKQVILSDAHVENKYYLSSSINEIILKGGIILHHKIESSGYHSFYAPSKIKEFERSNYAMHLRKSSKPENVNVVIPAAGRGSRFAKAGWKKPKPFIDINGKPMLERVIDNISPKSSKHILILQKEHSEQYSPILQKTTKSQIVPIDILTEGTACTVLLARQFIDNDDMLLIANSDQYVNFNVDEYIQDCIDRDLDGSILVFKDSDKDPKWSFAKIDKNGLVMEVAEKKPISDIATVGIYLFRKGSEFTKAAIDMIANNERVNGEFYTCPVYNYMINKGAKIGVWHVPMGNMYGLGTPEDLNKYLEKHNLPRSSDAPEN